MLIKLNFKQLYPDREALFFSKWEECLRNKVIDVLSAASRSKKLMQNIRLLTTGDLKIISTLVINQGQVQVVKISRLTVDQKMIHMNGSISDHKSYAMKKSVIWMMEYRYRDEFWVIWQITSFGFRNILQLYILLVLPEWIFLIPKWEIKNVEPVFFCLCFLNWHRTIDWI